MPTAPSTVPESLSKTGEAALNIIFPVEESSYGSVRMVFFVSMQLYHPRPVMSQPSSLVKPSDCVRMLASRSEIHAAMTFSESVPAMPVRLSITVSIFSDCQISSPGFVCIMTWRISGLTASCSALLVYCSKNPVIWFAAALDSCTSSVFFDVMLSHPAMLTETAAISRSTKITLPPI